MCWNIKHIVCRDPVLVQRMAEGSTRRSREAFALAYNGVEFLQHFEELYIVCQNFNKRADSSMDLLDVLYSTLNARSTRL